MLVRCPQLEGIVLVWQRMARSGKVWQGLGLFFVVFCCFLLFFVVFCSHPYRDHAGSRGLSFVVRERP